MTLRLFISSILSNILNIFVNLLPTLIAFFRKKNIGYSHGNTSNHPLHIYIIGLHNTFKLSSQDPFPQSFSKVLHTQRYCNSAAWTLSSMQCWVSHARVLWIWPVTFAILN